MKATTVLGILILTGIFLSFVFLVSITATPLQNALISFSFLLVSIGVWANKPKCPDPIVVYKYTPPTLEEQWENPQTVSEVYRDLFTKQSPWIARNTSIL